MNDKENKGPFRDLKSGGELADYFVKKYSEGNGLPVRPLSAEVRRALNLNRWPGNVRELKSVLHRAVLLATGAEIGIDGLLTPEGGRLDAVSSTGGAAPSRDRRRAG